jgi:16S rRNA G966 N2-methylase RsmD
MLYMSELNKKNVLICKQIFDINNEYELNLYNGDSLKLDTKKEWNIEKFDVIVGNPPYQDDSGNKGKGHTLWTKFIDIALNSLLIENGHLVFVHPSVWRQIEHPYLNKLKDKQLLYLEIHNSDDGMKTFRCATRYDWYVLQNNKYNVNTVIKGEDGKINNINLNEWNFIPNMMFDELKILINEKDKLDILHSESAYEVRRKWMSHTKTEKHIYPCVYSINKNNELSFKWSEITDKGHFKICKFIFTNGAGFYCDENGTYGLTQWASGIINTKDNLKLIEKAFRSEKFNKIKNAIQLDSSSYNIKVMKLFKKDFYNDFINNNNINKYEEKIKPKKIVKTNKK